MTNYKLTIAYEGTRYKGWQVQGNTDMTIQGKIQAVLFKMCGYEVEVHGSGRTDAGVHALGQTANFKLRSIQQNAPETHFVGLKECLAPEEIKRYLNTYLPEDIAVLSVEEVGDRFHARLSAVKKTYRYRLWTAKERDVFARRYVTEIKEPLNVEAMREGASYLVGTHDFTSFCGNRKFKKSAVRTIDKIEITKKEKEIVIDVTGNGFLQNMMRILVGTLVDVGKGTIQPAQVQEILDGRDRSLAGITMPAKGLLLVSVEYMEEKVTGQPELLQEKS